MVTTLTLKNGNYKKSMNKLNHVGKFMTTYIHGQADQLSDGEANQPPNNRPPIGREANGPADQLPNHLGGRRLVDRSTDQLANQSIDRNLVR